MTKVLVAKGQSIHVSRQLGLDVADSIIDTSMFRAMLKLVNQVVSCLIVVIVHRYY